MTDIIPAAPTPDSPLESDGSPDIYEVGQWFWVKNPEDEDDDTPTEWLGCLMQVGSNYLALESPHGKNSYHSQRVHLDEAGAFLRRERDAQAVITGQIDHFKNEASRLMGEVKELTARLGFQPQNALQGPAAQAGTGLAVLSQQVDVNGYKHALVQARDTDLPALFEQIKAANENLATWLSADTLPMQAMVAGMTGGLEAINDRIFNVTLYAGLTEEVVRCADGAPAAVTDKLHVMQRRCYMDEESLVGYRTGGLAFKDIGEFDDWLCQPENRDRILPFPRTMVAMRVRRDDKSREWDGTVSSLFVNFELGQLDKLTFLYIRNGDQVFRLNCDLDFDELIFPDAAMFSAGEPMMVKMFVHSVDKMITLREYEDRTREHDELQRKNKEWVEQNPGVCWTMNPNRSYSSFRPSDWSPFDDSNVYYDECAKTIADKLKRYNRIALIIQGLFDRSPVLHPHPPVKSWTAEGFAAAIELVYDGSAVLHNGPPPDFEAYRARCNELIDKDSVLYGQENFWLRKEAEKECARLDADWRHKSEWRPKTFKPYGNPGPGELARAAAWQPRARKAVFAWNRERQTAGDRWSGQNYGDPLRTTLTVPADELFNVSAYKPGDFKQFFQDSRTRAQYLKWAPMLLTAEEFYAGNREVQEPLEAGGA